MIQVEDIKVGGANVVCMIIAHFETINDSLQAVLITSTIVYTLARTINEVKKIRKNGQADSE